ncbi:hypothetical protein WUBG_02013 [Wuchereria bancrofti]|uniref:Uncharacterized protein n=1 Tax=Wuchereria bancrofti TaxID=6293 RepID=J9BI99_WUCBA|nr:hypothetical protein WUBG_02013 [Wuchereria bancrofti]
MAVANITLNPKSSQKQSKNKLSEKCSESEVTEKISARNRLKDRKMIDNGRTEQSTEMDSLQRMKSDGERNLKRKLNLRLNLEKKAKREEEKIKGQLRREKEWISKHSSDISTNNKAKRNSLERTNQKSTKIFSLSSSKDEKLEKNQLDDKNSSRKSSRKTIKSAKSSKRTVRTNTKKSSEKENLRNLQKFDRTSNANFK